MQKLIAGIRHFQTNIFEKQRKRFEQMAQRKQKPLALFITCSDSRVDPNLLMQAEPGELFIIRNAGNIIPPYGAASGGEGATIEYAVEVLEVRNIIICGHSQCGAMAALLSNTRLRDLPAVSNWITHAEGTRRIVNAKYADLPKEARELAAVEENVLVQLDNIRSHPAVAVGLARGDLNLYGWFYDIATGQIFGYEPDTGHFVSVTDSTPKPIPQNSRRRLQVAV
jgi:carbonic anhydrase